jgi:hypothetical protein
MMAASSSWTSAGASVKSLSTTKWRFNPRLARNWTSRFSRARSTDPTFAKSVGITTAVRDPAGTPVLRKSSLGKRCGRRKLVTSCWMRLSATSLAGSRARRTSRSQ